MAPFGNKEKVRGGPPPPLGVPGQKSASKSPPWADKEPDPADSMEPQEGEDHSIIDPNPEAVYYRTEAVTCQHCTYYGGGNCQHPMVAMPVEPGASCSAFEAGGGTDGGEEGNLEQDASQDEATLAGGGPPQR